MDGQNKLTAYTIPAHHVTQTNLLKSKQLASSRLRPRSKIVNLSNQNQRQHSGLLLR